MPPLTIFLLIVLAILFFGGVSGIFNAWDPKEVTDEDLYGMSKGAYTLSKLGDDQFRAYYGDEEYFKCKAELDNLKK